MNPERALADARPMRLLAAIVGLTVPYVWLWTTVTPSEVAARLRNAFGAQVGVVSDFDWKPDRVPAAYLLNRAAPPQAFLEIATRIDNQIAATADATGFGLSIAIARDLMRSNEHKGSPIRKNALQTYREITENRTGYCADFVKAFNSIAIASQVPVRQWGFAFTAFGSGHTFNEIYDQSLGKWVLVDSFHSLYFVDAESRVPLSTMQVHDRLLEIGEQQSGLEIVEIVPGALPFRSEALALDYYRRGMRQLWLVWGNGVFDFEQHPVIRAVSRYSRAGGQILGRLLKVYPTIRIYPVGVSERDLRELFRARDEFYLALMSCAMATGLFGVQIWQLVRRRRSIGGRT